MRLFANVKIGRRLAIGFGIILSFMVVAVVAGLWCLNLMDQTIERMVKVNNAKIRSSNDAKVSLAEITYLVGRIVTAQDDAGRADARKKVDERRTTYKQALETLETLEVNKKGKEPIENLKEKITRGKELNDTVIGFSLAGRIREASDKYGQLTETVEGYIQAARMTSSNITRGVWSTATRRQRNGPSRRASSLWSSAWRPSS